ncbi:hypothetical protein AAES_01147 [Amazona aestiva]|uniref:Uncharacterized protein n=1 Tax=Amazona aestiva TaxID=12930 RepID=A0A0Q3U585_AMAAE|nr:hypothetical protein AAES_01147 [Amazona aestiva]
MGMPVGHHDWRWSGITSLKTRLVEVTGSKVNADWVQTPGGLQQCQAACWTGAMKELDVCCSVDVIIQELTPYKTGVTHAHAHKLVFQIFPDYSYANLLEKLQGQVVTHDLFFPTYLSDSGFQGAGLKSWVFLHFMLLLTPDYTESVTKNFTEFHLVKGTVVASVTDYMFMENKLSIEQKNSSMGKLDWNLWHSPLSTKDLHDPCYVSEN